MCGIVALVGSQGAALLLLEGLRQLEYRGYESPGIATVNAVQQLSCLLVEGKLLNLIQPFEASGVPGQCCIGHTRWASHSKPEERKAHPHLDDPGRVVVLDNKISEVKRSSRHSMLTQLPAQPKMAALWVASLLPESELGLAPHLGTLESLLDDDLVRIYILAFGTSPHPLHVCFYLLEQLADSHHRVLCRLILVYAAVAGSKDAQDRSDPIG
jgi:glucosamine 6-phosphate synthetase-like amidotransferase/phosphosugar isomerase protein